MTNKHKGTWRPRVQRSRHASHSKAQTCDSDANSSEGLTAEEQQPRHENQQECPQEEQVQEMGSVTKSLTAKGKRKGKAKRSRVPISPNSQQQESSLSEESQAETPTALVHAKTTTKTQDVQAQVSPSHHQPSAPDPAAEAAPLETAGAPAPPVPVPPVRRKLKIWMRLCSMCMDKGSFCSAVLCPAYQRGQCEKGKEGSTCSSGLCHSSEGNYRIRNVPKGKNGKKSTALQEHQTKTLFAAHGFCVKNSFFDTESMQKRRDLSSGPDRSKDPFLRSKCHHCQKDAKQKVKRTEGVLDGRVLTMLVAGMLNTGTRLDTAWMEEGDAAANPLLQEEQHDEELARPIPSYLLATFRKELSRSRDSGGLFDPLGLTPMCQKVLCKHWIRGDCKSQRETCKFAHCHAGGFELKQGTASEELSAWSVRAEDDM